MTERAEIPDMVRAIERARARIVNDIGAMADDATLFQAIDLLLGMRRNRDEIAAAFKETGRRWK